MERFWENKLGNLTGYKEAGAGSGSKLKTEESEESSLISEVPVSDQKYNQGILKAQERHVLPAAAGSAGQTPVKA